MSAVLKYPLHQLDSPYPWGPRSPASYVDEYMSGRTLPFPIGHDPATAEPPQPPQSRPESACSTGSWWSSTSSNYSTDETSPSSDAPQADPVSTTIAELSAPLPQLEPESGIIHWTTADLNYLISILYPDQVLANQIHFAPPLETLPAQGMCDVALYTTSALPTTSASMCRKTCCTFQSNLTILADSGRCATAPEARKAIADMLLQEFEALNDLCAKYNVIAVLFALPVTKLHELQRTIPLMQKIKEKERVGRSWQLMHVDETYAIGARLEAYWLGPGWAELSAWGGCVDYVLGLEEKMRTKMGDVYDAAGKFLRKVVEDKMSKEDEERALRGHGDGSHW